MRHLSRSAGKRAITFLVMHVMFGVQASQEPLREPPVRASAGPSVSVTLTASNGSATVPGIGRIDGLYLYGASPQTPGLLPALWRVRAGQHVRLTLKNRLTCGLSAGEGRAPPDETNIHTHGLIVSPHTKNAQGRYGDFAFVIVESQAAGCTGTMASGHAGHMAMLPTEQGQAQYDIAVPADHPSGLYWYHPHVHSVSGAQVGGGMSGLITVGDIWDYAYLTCSLDPASPGHCGSAVTRQREAQARARTDVHHLMLKDLQLTRGTSPGRWSYNPIFDPGLCDGSTTAPSQGFCDATDGSRRWLFTVNGQHLPRIDLGAGRGAVLRIANVSANVTHILRLRADRQGGTPLYLPFQVMAVDGVAKSTATQRPATSRQVLMMPASRAELYVSAATLCKDLAAHGAAQLCSSGPLHLVLEQKGLAQPDADTWPPMDLATLQVATGAGDFADEVLNIAATRPDTTAPPAPASALVRGAAAATAPACDDGSTPTTLDAAAGQYRLIALKNGACINGTAGGCDPATAPEVFGMVTEGPRTWSGAPGDVVPTQPYREFAHDRVDMCVGAPIGTHDYAESWVIANQSGELHNFHVHQSKFEVLATSRGAAPDVAALPPTKEGAFHDTYPIDPGGWIKLRIRFDRPEQVGRFVYHCHILEHEDKGMMSVIQVVDTTH